MIVNAKLPWLMTVSRTQLATCSLAQPLRILPSCLVCSLLKNVVICIGKVGAPIQSPWWDFCVVTWQMIRCVTTLCTQMVFDSIPGTIAYLGKLNKHHYSPSTNRRYEMSPRPPNVGSKISFLLGTAGHQKDLPETDHPKQLWHSMGGATYGRLSPISIAFVMFGHVLERLTMSGHVMSTSQSPIAATLGWTPRLSRYSPMEPGIGCWTTSFDDESEKRKSRPDTQRLYSCSASVWDC